MELMSFWDQLTAVFTRTAMLLQEAGYDEECGELAGLEWDRDDPEAYYYVEAANSIARTLERAMERHADAMCPPDIHAYTLHRLANGRFGFYKNGYIVEMYCGRSVEALIGREGTSYWTRCTIEYEDDDYYVCSHYGVGLEGLVVRRIREGSDW